MSTFLLDNMISLSEAAYLWNIDSSEIRYAIKYKSFYECEVKKCESNWIIAKEAMKRVFGTANQTTDIFTIGYEGKNIEEFVFLLKNNNIHTIFDVREFPLSRKKGFSKNQLIEYLKDNGIQYCSFKELGSPKDIRDRLYSNWNYADFFIAYEKWLLEQPETFEIMKTAIAENCDKNFCLMCFEKKSEECHRSVIANQLIKSDMRIQKIINI